MNRIYCCFPGGKHKALTMSYDDGRTQDRRLIEIFNQNGIKGTFHLNSGLFDRGDRILPEAVHQRKEQSVKVPLRTFQKHSVLFQDPGICELHPQRHKENDEDLESVQ